MQDDSDDAKRRFDPEALRKAFSAGGWRGSLDDAHGTPPRLQLAGQIRPTPAAPAAPGGAPPGHAARGSTVVSLKRVASAGGPREAPQPWALNQIPPEDRPPPLDDETRQRLRRSLPRLRK